MFDSHAHYDDRRFKDDRNEILTAIEDDEGITGIINAAVDIKSSKMLCEIADKYKKHYAAVGYHPHEAKQAKTGYIDLLKEFANRKKVIAIGEIGLDYHYDFSPREIQKKVFEEQLLLALELDLPVIIHNREAHKDTVDMVLKYPKMEGVFHSYSGSVETAEILLENDFYLSFNGIITFKNAAKPRSVAAIVPDDRLLIETDCPYLTPSPHRGERNDSRYLVHIVDELARIRNQSREYIEEITTANAKRLFRIKE